MFGQFVYVANRGIARKHPSAAQSAFSAYVMMIRDCKTVANKVSFYLPIVTFESMEVIFIFNLFFLEIIPV